MWTFETLGKFRQERIKGEVITFDDIIRERLILNNNNELHCWIAKKNKRFYLIEQEFVKELPIKANKTQLHKEGKDVFHFISDFDSLQFEPKKYYEFNELADRFFDVGHSKPLHFLLAKLIAFASHFSRVNARLCAPIEFGKDGIFEVLNYLTNSAVVLDEPESIPRVKSAMNSSILVLNEIIATGEFATVFKKIYMSLGSRKPSYYPPKLGKDGSSVPIDVSNLSFITCYNRLDEISEKDKGNYFDFVFGKNTIKRYIPFLFSGKLDMRFIRTPINYNLDVDDELLKMARTMEWYRQNYKKELKPYSVDLSKLPLYDREKESFLDIVDCINLYSKDEAQFKQIVNELLECNYAYKRMLKSSYLITDYDSEQKPSFSAGEGDLEPLKAEIEEIVETPYQFIKNNGGEMEVEEFLKEHTEKEMDFLLKNGDIFYKNSHILKVLE